MEISKRDWDLYNEKYAVWQERFVEKLLKEYAEIIMQKNSSSERFQELKKRIQTDSQLHGVNMELSRKTVEHNLAMLLLEWVITVDDLEGFSPDLIRSVRTRAKK